MRSGICRTISSGTGLRKSSAAVCPLSRCDAGGGGLLLPGCEVGGGGGLPFVLEPAPVLLSQAGIDIIIKARASNTICFRIINFFLSQRHLARRWRPSSAISFI